jgi:DNA mismatch repair protein MutL
MSNIIKLLPDNVANQIAAGEVVQRPSSAVKELLENSIDAKADQIKLVIKDSGKTLIQVIDNGMGMSPADAKLCFTRHATSKISKADDLFNIASKGFRGEALASIAAISQIELKTKRVEDELASIVEVEGSEIKSIREDVGVNGTVISVKNLFFNVPARRNFLKSDNVEYKHIIEEFLRLAIAHTDISFNLIHNGNTSFNLEKSNLKIRLDQIFGSRSKDKYFPIEEDTELVKISGFVSKPEFAKKRRGEQYFFVNNRYIKSSYLNHAVSKAFESLIPSEHFPSYFIFLEVDPSTIDINIHPTKTEIKFEDDKSLYAILFSSIKHSLGQYNIAPSLDFEIDREMDDEIGRGSNRITYPNIDIDPNFNPFNDENNVDIRKSSSSGSGKFSSSSSSWNGNKKSNASWDSLYTGLEDVGEIRNELNDQYYQSDAHDGNLVEESFESKANFSDNNSFSSKYFQIHGRYIASQVKSGVMLVNQRRAHKRILFDEYMSKLNSHTSYSQQLLFPVFYSVDMANWSLIKELKSDLEDLGFDFGEYDNGNLEIVGIPSNFDESDINTMLDSILDNLQAGLDEIKSHKSVFFAKAYANTKAVKDGQKLTSLEMENIINQLFACENHNSCPSGKIINKIISIESLDESFN